MNKKSFKLLEFDKILRILAENTVVTSNVKKAEELEPFSDIIKVQNALDETFQAHSLILRRGNPPLLPLGDVLSHIKRLNISAILREKELLDIANLLKASRMMKDYALEDRELKDYFDSLIPLRNLEEEITSKILSEDEIADNASIKLYAIRKKIKSANEKIRELLNKFVTSPNYQKYLQEAIVTVRNDRFVLPVRIEYKGEIKGIVHDQSASGSTVFIEPMSVVEENNKLSQLASEERNEIERILYDITAMCALNSMELESNYNIIADLDFIFAKAQLALKMKATKPVVNNKGYINLRKARHPLIPADKVVPIDVYMGKDFDSLIITGPNTGGKTVTLKTIGLLCQMACSGLMIPALDKSDVAVYTDIFADIGDEQSIAQSLSTFSSHMVNIVSILNEVQYGSLVLFDELGAGTDPVEGASLAIAIIESLRAKGVKVVATTHYSELKLYALSTKGVQNGGCEFDVETLKPTYRLLIGIPGKSNAFAISEKLGLGEDVLRLAKSQINDENIKFEDVLAEIEKTSVSLEKERALANKYKEEAEELKKQLIVEKEKSAQKNASIIEKANAEAKRILEEAKEDADSIIKELREIRKNENQKDFDRKTISAKEKLSKKIKDRQSKINEGKKSVSAKINPVDLLPGASVRLINHDMAATVLTKPDDKGNLTVTAGIMKINVNISELAIDTKEKQKEMSYVTVKKQELQNKKVTTELDIRGYTVTDGVLDAEKFIDDAVLLRMEKVSIIHGKGTGVLRSAIHSMLKNHRQVKSFRLGVFGEGETGVTIVELKV
ncbi:MAG: endonuclease MutS2 [Clostridia bacterium]|nr:endonuclease MutS2 [Clostridia bacterium]